MLQRFIAFDQSLMYTHCKKNAGDEVYFEWLFLLYTNLSFLYTCGTQVLKHRLKTPQVPHPIPPPPPKTYP